MNLKTSKKDTFIKKSRWTLHDLNCFINKRSPFKKLNGLLFIEILICTEVKSSTPIWLFSFLRL
jgi:hypothetical protein